MLLGAIVLVATKIYQLWQEGPWELSKLGKGKGSLVAKEAKREPERPQLASTKNIIEKNLFDLERGASRTRDAEASSMALERIRNVVLVGTAILGDSRYAIFQELPDSRPSVRKAQAGQAGQLRLKLGDTLEGFKLAGIYGKRVVFTRGTSRVEVPLGFSRRVEPPSQKTTAPPPARLGLAPRIPRRDAASEESRSPRRK